MLLLYHFNSSVNVENLWTNKWNLLLVVVLTEQSILLERKAVSMDISTTVWLTDNEKN